MTRLQSGGPRDRIARSRREEPALESTQVRREQFPVLHHLHRRDISDRAGLDPAAQQRHRRVVVDAAGGGHILGRLAGVEEGASGPMATHAQAGFRAARDGSDRCGGHDLHGSDRLGIGTRSTT